MDKPGPAGGKPKLGGGQGALILPAEILETDSLGWKMERSAFRSGDWRPDWDQPHWTLLGLPAGHGFVGCQLEGENGDITAIAKGLGPPTPACGHSGSSL